MAKSKGKKTDKKKATSVIKETPAPEAKEKQQTEAEVPAAVKEQPTLTDIIKRDRSAQLSNAGAQPEQKQTTQKPVPFTRQVLTNANTPKVNANVDARPAQVQRPGLQQEVSQDFFSLCGRVSDMLLRERTVNQPDVRALLFDRKSILDRTKHSIEFKDCGRVGSNTNFKVIVKEHGTGQEQELPFGADKFVRLFHIPGKKK